MCIVLLHIYTSVFTLQIRLTSWQQCNFQHDFLLSELALLMQYVMACSFASILPSSSPTKICLSPKNLGSMRWKARCAWPCLRFPAKGPHLKFPGRKLETKEVAMLFTVLQASVLALGSHCGATLPLVSLLQTPDSYIIYTRPYTVPVAVPIPSVPLLFLLLMLLLLPILFVLLVLSYHYHDSYCCCCYSCPSPSPSHCYRSCRCHRHCMDACSQRESPHLDSIGLGEGSFPGIVAVSCLASRNTLVAFFHRTWPGPSTTFWKLPVLWHTWHMIPGGNK